MTGEYPEGAVGAGMGGSGEAAVVKIDVERSHDPYNFANSTDVEVYRDGTLGNRPTLRATSS